jgi:hypothetical protein
VGVVILRFFRHVKLNINIRLVQLTIRKLKKRIGQLIVKTTNVMLVGPTWPKPTQNVNSFVAQGRASWMVWFSSERELAQPGVYGITGRSWITGGRGGSGDYVATAS